MLRRFFTLATLGLACSGSLAQDTSLSAHLVPGKGWEPAATGFTFTDGLCTDAAGNLYFTDVKAGEGIYKIDAETGAVSLAVKDLPGISGLQIGPDGRFYACHNREKRIIAFPISGGDVQVLASDVKCNDLVVTQRGFIYFTETPTKSIHVITPEGKHRVAAEGQVNRPNGITVSPDEQTLVVSDHGGLHVWAFQIQPNGDLTAGAPFMTMRPAIGKEEALGDGATTEAEGRFFVTTEIGIQMFDPAGRLSGVIDKPTPESKVVSVEFAGKDHHTLFVAAGDSIYRRPMQTAGYFR